MQIYEIFIEKANFYPLKAHKRGEISILSGEFANIDALSHYKRLREGATQTTKKYYSLLL